MLTPASGKPGAPPARCRGSRLIRDEHWHAAPARVARAKLSVGVAAPAVGLAARCDCARVVPAGKDGPEELIRVDRKRIVTARGDRLPGGEDAGLRCLRAELTVAVLSPTARCVAGANTTCMLRASAQR